MSSKELEEAIKHLNMKVELAKKVGNTKGEQANRLGVEALQFIQERRDDLILSPDDVLPSEEEKRG